MKNKIRPMQTLLNETIIFPGRISLFLLHGLPDLPIIIYYDKYLFSD